MADVDKARNLFRGAGLAFPTIPENLAPKLKERGKGVFSSRTIPTSPYNLQQFVEEAKKTRVRDYAIIAHSGHGVNSCAIQYYLVWMALRMFLHLGWGGVYMDADAAASRIRECLSKADQIVEAVRGAGKLEGGQYLTVVASNFYGSYWLAPGKSHKTGQEGRTVGPEVVLADALEWLKNQ